MSEDTDFGPQLRGLLVRSIDPVTATSATFYQEQQHLHDLERQLHVVTDRERLVCRSQGQDVPVTLTKGLTLPALPKRTYKAVVLDFNRADDGHWLASGSVTWSKSWVTPKVRSSRTPATAPRRTPVRRRTSTTCGLGDYSYGLLPNDHRWAFKLFGAYHFSKMFTLGANIFVQSPMHGSCLGYAPLYPTGCRDISTGTARSATIAAPAR